MAFPKKSHKFPDTIEEEVAAYFDEVNPVEKFADHFILFFIVLLFGLVVMWAMGFPVNNIIFK